jgi:hypothetical protein
MSLYFDIGTQTVKEIRTKEGQQIVGIYVASRSLSPLKQKSRHPSNVILLDNDALRHFYGPTLSGAQGFLLRLHAADVKSGADEWDEFSRLWFTIFVKYLHRCVCVCQESIAVPRYSCKNILFDTHPVDGIGKGSHHRWHLELEVLCLGFECGVPSTPRRHWAITPRLDMRLIAYFQKSQSLDRIWCWDNFFFNFSLCTLTSKSKQFSLSVFVSW